MVRGMPRCVAQRPLPSMMMATWRGISFCGAFDMQRLSDLHDLGFLGLQGRVSLLDRVIGHLLDLVGLLLVLVFTHEMGFLESLQLFHSVSADVADSNARLFGILMRNLYEFLTTLLG